MINWPDFMSNLLSTVLGVVFGIPVALWLNRRVASLEAREAQRAEGNRLRHGLHSIHDALQINQTALNSFETTLGNQKVPFILDLDGSAWESVRTEITPYLRDASLQRRLGFHFSRISSLVRLNGMYLELAVGVSSAMSNSGGTRQALRDHLNHQTRCLLDEIKTLSSDVNDALAKIPGDRSPQA
jgi:hypothetical protein